jgi:predicted nucleic acid-binding protein
MSAVVRESQEVRVYLDSNVVISASINGESRFLDFWRLSGVTPVLSRYAIDEVARNLRLAEHKARFAGLILRCEIVSDLDVRIIPSHIELASKDGPILAAAIGASVDFLATGDRSHFGHLYNLRISGVQITSPGHFLDRYEERLLP